MRNTILFGGRLSNDNGHVNSLVFFLFLLLHSTVAFATDAKNPTVSPSNSQVIAKKANDPKWNHNFLTEKVVTSTYSSTNPGGGRAWFVKRGVNSGDTSSTIDAAIVKASSNDTILIYPELYNESINVRDKSLVIASTYARNNNADVIKETIIDGSGITDNFLRNSISNWWGTYVTFIGITIQNFQGQLNSTGEFKMKFYNSILKSNGGSDNFISTYWGIEIKNCELNSNNGRLSFNGWESNREYRFENNKFINHNLSSNWWWNNDGSGQFEITDRGKFYFINNLFFNCSGTANNYVIKTSQNENDSLFVINNTFINNDINVLRATSKSNILFQNNLLNSNARNSNSELSFSAKTKIRFFRNVTFQALNKYTGFSQIDTTGSGVNFIFQDLKLVNKTNPNSSSDKFYPSSKSPFLGLGRIVNSPSTDLDGTFRPNPTGSAPEIGAFEINLSLVPPVLNALEATQNKITLSWSRYKGEKDDKIRIFRSTTGNTNTWMRIAVVDVIDGDSFIDSVNISVGTKYYYAINMVGLNGDSSLFSNTLNVTPVSTPPSVPANVKISSSPSRIRVYWDKINSVDTITYNIYRSISGSTTFSLYQTGIVDNYFVDTAVNRGQDYSYKVRSVNTQNNASELSSVVSISTAGKRWFVSTKGNDSDIGSQEYPFLTIANAIKNTYTGDSVILNKGVYTNPDNYVIDSSITIMSLFPLNSDSSFIKNTIIDGEGMSTNRSMFTGATTKMTFSSLTFRNFPFMFMSDEKELIIENSILDNINTSNNGDWQPNFALGNNSVLRYNIFKNSLGYISVRNNAIIEKNKFLLSSGSSDWRNNGKIRVETGGGLRKKIFITNNLFQYDKKLIQVSINAAADSLFIINNTFIYKGNSGTDNYSIQFYNNAYKLILKNNIFYPTNNLWFGSSNNNSNVHFYATNNILVEPFGISPDFKFFNIKDTSNNIISNDPGFTNPRTDNYELTSKSIALGRGNLEKSPNKDLLDRTRPAPSNSNPDIGAFENSFSIANPTITTAEGSDQRITLFWDQKVSDELDSFYIYRTGPNVDNTLQQAVPYARIGKENVSFTDSVGITNKDRYYYRIKSIDTSGNASDFSNLIIARANVQPVGITGLTVNSSPGLVLLSWAHAEPDQIKFNIYRGLSSNSLNLISTGVKQTNFIDTSINRAVTYFYSVKAVDTVGASSPLSEIKEIKSTGRTWFVDTIKRTTSIGSKENPFNEISRAMKFAATSDTIKILPGEYFEQLRIRTKPLYIVSTYFEDYNESTINNTIINGSKLSSTSHLISDSSNNSSSYVEINGLTFKGAPNYVFNFSRVRFRKSVFTENRASNGTFGGSFLVMDSIKMTNNGPSPNTWGCCDPYSRFGDSTIIRNSRIENNSVRDNAVLNFEAWDNRKSYSPVIESSVLINNVSSYYWGSAYVIRGNSRNLQIKNNLIINNSLYAVSLNPNNWENNTSYSHDLIHNTIVSNKWGIRIEGWNRGNINIVNNIIQNNQTQFSIESNASNPLKVDFINNIIGTTGDKAVLKNITNIGNIDTSSSTGNFSAEFNFIDTTNGNFKITGNSAAIGTGDITKLPQAFDKDGSQRPNPENTNPDIGAFESPFSIASPKLFTVEGGNQKTFLQWDHSISNNKLKYYIYRSTSSIDSLGSSTVFDSVAATINSYVDSTNLVNLTKYFYRIKAVDENYNLSAFSNQLFVIPNKPLSPPDSIRIETAPWRLKIIWKDTTFKAKSFNVYRGASRENLRLLKSGVIGNYFVDSSVIKNTEYIYSIKSVDSVGAVSDTSNTITGSFRRNIFYVNNKSSIEPFGSSESPLNSIQAALQLAKSGDTLLLLPSVYPERISISNSVVFASKYIIDQDTSNISKTIISGSTIKNFNYLIGTTSSSYYSYSPTIVSTQFIGLTFQDFSGGLIDLSNQNTAIKNSIIRNITANCNSLLSLGANSVIEKNKFFGNSGNIPLRSGMIVNQNEFYDTKSTCNSFFLSNSDNKVRIQNNLFINSEQIDIYLSGYDTSFVVHNTFYKKDQFNRPFIRFDSYNSSYNFIYNNIFSKKSGYDFEFNNIYNGDSSRSTLDLSYNAIGKKLSDVPNITSYKSKSRNNFISLRLAFRNPDQNNFILQKSSQAIGIGLDSNILTKKDLFDVTRPNPERTKPDLGAIESEIGIPGPEITRLTADNKAVSISWVIIDTSNIANYRVFRSDTTSSPTSVLFESATANVTSIIDTTGDLGKTYYYRVRAVRRDGTTSDYSDSKSIKLYNAPILVTPLDNVFLQKITDTLKWNKSGNGVTYDLHLSNDITFSVRDSSVQSDTFFVYSNLKNNTNYYWKLRVRDSISTSAWSIANKFQTILEIPKFSEVKTLGDSLQLKFIFDTSAIKSYKLYKSVDSSQNILYSESSNFNVFRDTLQTLKPTYFKISLKNTDDKESGLSEVVKITTFASPILSAPANGTTGLQLKSTFKWQRNQYSTLGNIQISRDSLFNNLHTNFNVSVDSLQLIDSNALLPNTNYYWRVRLGDKYGFGFWSQIHNFQTFIEPPILNKVSAGNKVDTLYWVLRGDSSRYKKTYIYRDTVENPTTLIDSTNGSTSVYIDTIGLKINKRYYYRLKAANIENTISDFSTILSSMPFNIKPKASGLIERSFSNVGLYNKVRVTQTSTKSTDPDGIIKKVKWYVNDELINETDSTFVHYYSQGTNNLKLVVEDNDGDIDSTFTTISLKSFQTAFNGGILGGITAVSPDIIYAADSTYDPIKGAQVNRLDRNGKITFPLIVSSKIFTTPSVASDSSVFITSGSSLNGFDKSGAPLWPTIPLGGLSYVTPTIDSMLTRLYVGVSNRNFFSFDYKTGKSVWNILCDAPINASAVITGDRKLVYVSEKGTMYGFDIRTDAKQTEPKWLLNLNESVYSSAAVDLNNDLYFGTNLGKLFKVRLNNDSTSSIIWKTSLDSAIYASPVIDSRGYLYVGTSSGKIYRINSVDGKVMWDYSTGGTIKSTPVITNNSTVVFANTRGKIVALDTTSKLIWSHIEGSPISANLLFINYIVYAGTEKGDLIGIYNNPAVNSINNDLSFGKMRFIIPEYNKSSLANHKNSKLTGTDLGVINNYVQSDLNEVISEEQPVWGTFQGNYRRTGSRKLDCPDKPLLSQNGTITICEGDNLVISSSKVSNSSWLMDGKILDNSDSIIQIKQQGAYSRMIKNDNGCTVYSDQVIVNVNKSPEKPSVSLNGKNIICEGETVQLSSSASSSNTWYRTGSNKIISTQQSAIIDTTGEYFVRVTSSNGCTINSDAITIKVTKKPELPSITANSKEFCSGDSTMLSISTDLSTQWYFNGIAIFNADKPSYTVKNAGVYSVKITNGDGCNVTSKAIDISVKPTTEIPSIITNGLPILCKGSTLLLTATVNANNVWYKNGVKIGTGQFIIVSDSGYYKVTATRTNMCLSQSDSMSVSISTPPTRPTISMSGDAVVCEGSSPTLTSSASTGNQWYRDGSLISGATGTSYKPTVSGVYNVAYGQSSCLSDTSIGSKITVKPMPVVKMSASATSICSGGSAVLLVNTESSGVKYQWYRDGALISGATSNSYNATDSGSYAVKVTLDGCERQTSAVAVKLTKTPDKPTITRNQSDLISNFSTGNQWFTSTGTAIAGATSQSFRPTTNGYYTVKTTVNGCASTSSEAYYYLSTAVINLDNDQFIRIFPNPVTSNMSVEFKLVNTKYLYVKLIDMNGRTVAEFKKVKSGEKMNAQQLAKGTYMILLLTDDGKIIYSGKIAKH